jgi:hypothetical protein
MLDDPSRDARSATGARDIGGPGCTGHADGTGSASITVHASDTGRTGTTGYAGSTEGTGRTGQADGTRSAGVTGQTADAGNRGIGYVGNSGATGRAGHAAATGSVSVTGPAGAAGKTGGAGRTGPASDPPAATGAQPLAVPPAPLPADAAPDSEAPAYGLPAGRIADLLAAATVAGHLAGRLFAAPRPDRLGMIAADPAFRRDSLALLLALAAEERLEAPPPAAEEYAELALAVALALPPGGAANARGLESLASWLLGKAQLRAGNLGAAEWSLRRAARRAAAGASLRKQALAVAGLAQLRWQQRLPEQALALFATAGRLYTDLGDLAGVAACRGLSGFLLLGAGDPQRARLELRAAHHVLGRSLAPSLAVLVCLALADGETAAGATAGPDLLALADEAARACMAPVLGLGRWWGAVLVRGAAAKHPPEAAGEPPRRRALTAADPADPADPADLRDPADPAQAARLTLDQAMAAIAAGASASVAGLTAQLAAAGSPEAARWAAEIAALAGLAAAQPDAYPPAARQLALRLAAAGIASLGARGLPWGLCDLADRLLRHVGENDHAIGAAQGL